MRGFVCHHLEVALIVKVGATLNFYIFAQFFSIANVFLNMSPNPPKKQQFSNASCKWDRKMARSGHRKRLSGGRMTKMAFVDFKRRFVQNLCLIHPCLHQPFSIFSYASDLEVGAKLCQDFYGVWKTMALFYCKLTRSQLISAVREKEMYVACLHKWSE